jgi:hypothetical protein
MMASQCFSTQQYQVWAMAVMVVIDLPDFWNIDQGSACLEITKSWAKHVGDEVAPSAI